MVVRGRQCCRQVYIPVSLPEAVPLKLRDTRLKTCETTVFADKAEPKSNIQFHRPPPDPCNDCGSHAIQVAGPLRQLFALITLQPAYEVPSYSPRQQLYLLLQLLHVVLTEVRRFCLAGVQGVDVGCRFEFGDEDKADGFVREVGETAEIRWLMEVKFDNSMDTRVGEGISAIVLLFWMRESNCFSQRRH
jgi:hypothetical protein